MHCSLVHEISTGHNTITARICRTPQGNDAHRQMGITFEGRGSTQSMSTRVSQIEITDKFAICESLRLQYTANLTAYLTMTCARTNLVVDGALAGSFRLSGRGCPSNTVAACSPQGVERARDGSDGGAGVRAPRRSIDLGHTPMQISGRGT